MKPTTRTTPATDANMMTTNPFRNLPTLAAALAALVLTAIPARATSYYWDSNGAAGFTTITGAWNGTNAFWNTNNTGATSGTFVASPTAADDLLINGGTTGTITLTGTQVASSLTFAVNVAATLTGGTSLTIGGGGANSGILVASGDNAANTVSSPLILNSTSTALNFSNAGTGLLTIGAVTGAATTGTQTVTVGSGSSGGITLNGIIGNGAGGGNVAVTINNTSTGATTLSANNGFSGPVTLQNGTLMANGNANALGTGAATLALNAGTLDLNHSAALSFNRNTTVGGGITIISEKNAAGAGVTYTLGTLGIGAGTLNVTGGNVTSGTAGLTFGTTTLSGSPTFAVTNPVGGGATTLTLDAVGDGSAGYGLIKSGSGNLVLSGATTYTGTTAVNAGMLQFGSSTFSAAARSVTVADGVGATVAAGYAINNSFLNRLAENGNAYTVALALASGNALDFSSSTGATLPNASLGATGTYTYSGTLTPNGTTYRLGGGGGTLTVSSALTGGGDSLVVTGPGTVILSGTNSYGGATTVSSGSLQFASAAALGSTSGISMAAGLTVAAGYDLNQTFLNKLAGDSNAFVVGLAATGTQNLDFSSATGANLSLASLGATGTISYSGTLTPYGTTYRLGGGGGTLTVSSSTLTGNNDLIVTGPGTVALSSPANTFTGNVTVNSGTLNVTTAGALNNISRTVTVNSPGIVNFSAANAASAAAVTVNTGTVNVTATNALNGGSVKLNTSGWVSTSVDGNTVTVNTSTFLAANTVANAFAGSTLYLSGGTARFGRSTSTDPYSAGGNFQVQANSELDSYSTGTANQTIQYGSLDFDAANPGTYPNGYQLLLTDYGVSYNFGPKGVRSQFNNSIISHSGWVNIFTYAWAQADAGGTATLEFNNTSVRAGQKLTVTANTSNAHGGSIPTKGSLIGSLGIATLGGAELLTSNVFTLLTFPTSQFTLTDASAFDTSGGLWSRSGTTTITATLVPAKSVGSITYDQIASFTAASSGYVNLTGLTMGNSYPLTLTLVTPANQAAVVTQLAKNPAFTGVAAYGTNQVTLKFTAPAATTYFVWDNVHSSSPNWYLGDNLTAVYMGPSLTASATLTPFTTTTGTASSAQNFAVTGVNLTANVTCAAPAGFEVSTDGSTYAGSVDFIPGGVNSSVSGTLYVRLAAATAPGSYSGNVTLTSTGISPINIAANGIVYTVGGTPTITEVGSLVTFVTNVGTPSPAQSVFVSGAFLIGNITCTAPSGYEVSTDGTTYADTASYTPSGGSASGNLYVRLAAATPIGAYTGFVTLTSNSATTVYVSVTGTVYDLPSILAPGSLSSFATTYGTASAAQELAVFGYSLTTNLTCTAPTGFEVSTDGSAYAGAVNFTPSGGSVSGTLYVRLAATNGLGSYSGNIALTSGAAPPLDIGATGTVTLATGDGTWVVDASGTWGTPTNWLNNQAADGQGKTASFTNNIFVNRTITLDSPRTLGVLNVGDTNNSASFTIGGSASLTFDNGGANARFNQVATSAGDTVAGTVPILLNGSLDIANASASNLTINAAITANSAGTKTLTNLGPGTGSVMLAGSLTDGGGALAIAQSSGTSLWVLAGTNTYSGGTTVSAGTLQFNATGSIGGSGRDVTASGGTVLAAGYAIDNAFLNRVTENSNAFTMALGASSGNALDFGSSTGANLPNASLGAVGACTYSGTLTPNGTTYRLGGGGGTLTVSSSTLTGGNSLAVTGPGTVVVASAANTFTGDVTVNSGTLQLTTAGAFNSITRNVTLNPGGVMSTYNVPNGLAGCAIHLNGGTNRFGRNTTDDPYLAGGNFVVQANSQFDSYNSSIGNPNLANQYGGLDFAAADPVAHPNGYVLNLTDTGVSYNFGPSGVISRFIGSIISHSGAIQFTTAAYTGADPRGMATLELNNTSIRAGMKATITTVVQGGGTTAGKLTGSLGVAALGGAELLAGNTFTMFQFPTSVMALSDTSTFDTSGGVWTKSGTTTITATLGTAAGSIGNGETASFAAAGAGYVSLTGLTMGSTYPLTLGLASAADQAAVMAQLAKNAAFSTITAVGTDKVTLQFTAPAATSYFVWDNLHTSSADWHLGGNLSAVALATDLSLTGYASWASTYAGGGSPGEDYNHDGIANGVAYFMGANGLATNPGVVGGTVTWPYLNAVTSFEVQVSDNLVDWAPANPLDVATTPPPNGQVIYTLPGGAAKKFCRLMVVP